MNKITRADFKRKRYFRLTPFNGENYYSTYYIIGLMFLFFVAKMFIPNFLDYVALGSDVFDRLYLWQFVTYPFITLDPINLILSAVILFFMGLSFESQVGSLRFLFLFFTNTIMTGFLSVCVHYVAVLLGYPMLFVGALHDSSVVLNAIIFAYACQMPDARLYIYFVLPVSIKIGVLITVGINLVFFFVTLPSLYSVSLLLNLIVPYLYLKFVMKMDVISVFKQ